MLNRDIYQPYEEWRAENPEDTVETDRLVRIGQITYVLMDEGRSVGSTESPESE